MTHTLLAGLRQDQAQFETTLHGQPQVEPMPHLDRVFAMATAIWVVFGVAILAS